MRATVGSPVQPQVLPPTRGLRSQLAQTVFAPRHLDALAHLLDDCFLLPGTSFRFGVDGLIGLVPLAGDALAGLASSLILIAAWVHGVPRITLLRMLVNVGLGILIGTVPVLGDLFDVAWKPNRRNYVLLRAHLASPHRHTWRDWLFLFLLLGGLLALLAVPVFALVWLAHVLLPGR